MLDLLSRRWWWMLVRGLAAILFGIAAFARPGMTIWVLVMLFAAYAIIDGASMIVFGRRMGNWFWYALAGLVSMAAGVIAIAWPGISAMALLWVIAAWAILSGIFQIMSGMEIRKEVEGEWVLYVGGALAILFGLMLFFRPGTGALSVVWLIGTFMILFGILQVILAFKLKGLQGKVGDVKDAVEARMDK